VNILLLDLGNEFRGGQRQVLHLMRRLDDPPRRRVGLAAPVGSPIARAALEEGLPVHPLPGHLDYDPRNLMALKRILSAGPFQILHSNDARAASLGAMARLFTPELKLVHTRRVSYPLKKGWSAWKYHAADAVVAVSREIAELMAYSGLPPGRIKVIHSGLDPQAYPRKETGSGREEIVFGLVGAFTPQKGVHVFLDALARVRRSRPDLKFLGLIVGDGPLAGQLEDYAVSLGLDDVVAFPGWVESGEVLPEMDVLAVPSLHGEGSSAAIKEAWAAGLPVVCSDLPSNLELVEPGESGLAFRSGEASELAGKLIALAEDPELRRSLVRGGDERLGEFSVERMAEHYRRFYESLRFQR
jgi:glycosyltransferase involved in cell wall biosynthesis